MNARFDWFKAAPQAAQSLLKLQTYVNDFGLDHTLLELVKLRTSQINGCGYCIDMHTKDARASGETEQRLYLTSAWREAAHLYSAKEQAALAWTEAVTLVADGHVPDDVYAQARAQFSEAELVTLTLAISSTNAWNRLNIAFRKPAGDYQPGMFKAIKRA
jgi:AhpD family alkylhydroperoxidase